MSTNDDIKTVENAIENCSACSEAFFPTKRFNETYKPLLDNGLITEKGFDDRFASMAKGGISYTCRNCPNMLYNR